MYFKMDKSDMVKRTISKQTHFKMDHNDDPNAPFSTRFEKCGY